MMKVESKYKHRSSGLWAQVRTGMLGQGFSKDVATLIQVVGGQSAIDLHESVTAAENFLRSKRFNLVRELVVVPPRVLCPECEQAVLPNKKSRVLRSHSDRHGVRCTGSGEAVPR